MPTHAIPYPFRLLLIAVLACIVLAVLTISGITTLDVSVGATSGRSEAQRVAFSAREHRLSTAGLDALRPGSVRISVANRGDGEHGLVLAQLEPGVTRAQVRDSLDDPSGESTLALVVPVGGPASVPPGSTWKMAATLERGDYVYFDGGQDDAGKPNFQRGMFGFFAVAGHSAGAELPQSAGSIAMRDFGFGLHIGKRFSGRGWVSIPNRGAQLHELAVVKVDRGVSTREAIEAIHKLAQGQEVQPPGVPTEILGAIGPGKTARVKVDLAPGRYVAICLVPDAASGKLHTELGMIRPLRIR